MSYVSFEEGKQALESVLAGVTGWRQRRIRVKYYSVLRAKDALDEELEAAKEAAKATPQKA